MTKLTSINQTGGIIAEEVNIPSTEDVLATLKFCGIVLKPIQAVNCTKKFVVVDDEVYDITWLNAKIKMENCHNLIPRPWNKKEINEWMRIND